MNEGKCPSIHLSSKHLPWGGWSLSEAQSWGTPWMGCHSIEGRIYRSTIKQMMYHCGSCRDTNQANCGGKSKYPEETRMIPGEYANSSCCTLNSLYGFSLSGRCFYQVLHKVVGYFLSSFHTCLGPARGTQQ